MQAELIPTRYPRVPYPRRCAAFAIDFLVVGLIGLMFGLNWFAQLVVFLLAWIGLRAVLAARNQGQSPGKWALDMRVVDAKFGGTPLLQPLLIREGMIGVAALFALWGVTNLSPAAAWSLLLFIPLGADCSIALIDSLNRQAFHDRYARTLVVQSRRGYSLDLKIKQLLAKTQSRVK